MFLRWFEEYIYREFQNLPAARSPGRPTGYPFLIKSLLVARGYDVKKSRYHRMPSVWVYTVLLKENGMNLLKPFHFLQPITGVLRKYLPAESSLKIGRKDVGVI